MNPFEAINQGVFQPIFTLIAQTIVMFHRGLTSLGLAERSGLSWVLSIILLTVTVRILLFPIFVKQIKTQRAMQVLQPKIKALQAKHKGDRETLNTELMKLYKEHGANPLAGCLPMFLQMPVFIGMYQVLTKLRPKLVDGALIFPDGKYGVSDETAEHFGRAKVFGAPISSAFNSPPDLLKALDAVPTAVKVVALILIAAMTTVTFISTKQMMAKSNASKGTIDPQQATQQKIMLYVLPAMLAVFGFGAPLGVLVYWTTSNLWSLGQQVVVLKRMPHPDSEPPLVSGKLPKSPAPTGGSPRGAAKAIPAPALADGAEAPPIPGPARTPPKPRKKNKGGRRGGRR
ncbi:MAG TPA: membrane protein insertase YidC [Mycobacteriales bacterium]|nr:membrane protein insertase YidC [Mycobacteriales bacterium]